MTTTDTITKTHIQVGTFGWSHSSLFLDEDGQAETTITETCTTCRQLVTEHTPHWYCDENGELVHEGCELPDFDKE